MNNKRTPAERFSPGMYIQEEMTERGWTVEGLAGLLEMTPYGLSELLKGEKHLSLGIAVKLGKAFGTGWKLWHNLEKAYRGEVSC